MDPKSTVNRTMCIVAVCWVPLIAAGCLEAVPTAEPSLDGSADHLKADAVEPLPEVRDSLDITALIVPGGSFRMGNALGKSDEQPVHEVTVASFVMDKYEMTQDVYAKLELPNPAHFKGSRRPVEQVRWSDAALFCNERSRAAGLEPCYDEITFACDFDASGYRLPTEAEWEYAATVGGTVPPEAHNKTDARQLAQVACYAGTSAEQTQPVGQTRANAWGFCDMQGNIAEWCHDVYAENYYGQSESVDPRGPENGPKRVLRGGSWKSNADDCRLTARLADDPGISDACFARDTFGFRCVRKTTP